MGMRFTGLRLKDMPSLDLAWEEIKELVRSQRLRDAMSHIDDSATDSFDARSSKSRIRVNTWMSSVLLKLIVA